MADHATSRNPAVQRQLDRLTMLSPGRDVLGLERITALMDRLGNPHRKLPPVFHIAGTNGKGSTCAFLRAALEAAGHRVHAYTSPHLVRFNERIRISGELIADVALAPLLSEVLDCSEDIAPSFFEATTAAAFLAFSRSPADAAIIEVGLGGRLDATNIIEAPLVCGIAQIGVDHEGFLLDKANGPDWPPLERIAWEKAGIAKSGAPLVVLDQDPEVEKIIDVTARAAGTKASLAVRDWSYGLSQAGLHFQDRQLITLPAPQLAGEHQARNLALAIAMIRHQDRLAVPLEAMKIAALDAFWPGRLQRLGPGPVTRGLPKDAEVWLDGAHNPAAGLVLADHFHVKLPRGAPFHLITGVLANKDAAGLLSPFRDLVTHLTAIPIPGHPCHDPAEIAAMMSRIGIASDTAPDVQTALALSRESMVLIAGSLYLAGQVLEANGQIPD